MRGYLVDQNQPFGMVKETPMHPGTPCEYGYSAKGLGDKAVILNHGSDHAPTLASHAPGAMAQAMAHHTDPYFWTGKPVK